MVTTVLFTLDIDPSFPWRSDIRGLKEFLGWLKKARCQTDFVCEMNFTGNALIQIVKISPKILNQLKELVKAQIIEVGNHGYTHRPFVSSEKNFGLKRYMSGKKITNLIKTMIYERQKTDNTRTSLRYAINFFLARPKDLSKQEIIYEIRKSNNLLKKVFSQQPHVFRAPFFSSSQLVSEIIQKEGIKCDLSSYIEAEGNRLQAVVPRDISGQIGKLWEVPTSAKLDPNPWIENISTYKPGLLPSGLTVIIMHPSEFTFTYPQSRIVKKRFLQLLEETDKFILSEKVIEVKKREG